ncbi:MAG TPA: amidohydrolase family protein [Geobacteraceae bacterium]|jgi:predicted TIM-barrel fold metal-dependent hydrolase|nr:amidohydrolase family protein [Geobacteraceae bacterium]
MIIDCHCHYGKGDGLSGPWDTSALLDKYLHRANRAGISRTVLFSLFHSDYAVANLNVARMVRSRPERYFGFACLHPERDRGRVYRMVETAVLRYGFCGVKVHRHDGRMTREICETLRAFTLPVIYDVMGEVSQVELLAAEYPEVSFIIPHLGSFADDWRAHKVLIDLLERYPNVYTDTSGVRRFDLLEEAVERGGAEKLLFGSDGPWLHPGVELAKVLALDLSEEDRYLILGKKLLQLIGRVRRNPVPIGSESLFLPTADLKEYLDPWQAGQLP